MSRLLASAAKTSIMPDEKLMKAIAQEDPVLNYFDGAYEDIFTRVIVLSDGDEHMVFITADLNRYPAQQALCERLCTEFGIEPLACVIGSIRNHQAPCGNVVEENPPLCRRIAGPALTAYTRRVHEATVKALSKALATLRPARLGAVTTESFINSNIEWPTPAGMLKGNYYKGFSDRNMLVMRVADMQDKTIALLVNYAVHSTMFAQNTYARNFSKIGGDVVGAVTRFIEKANREQFPVVYMSADGGDQELLVYDEVVYCDMDDNGNIFSKTETLPMDAAWMLMKLLASQQAVDIINAVDEIKSYSGEFNFFGSETHRQVASRIAEDAADTAQAAGGFTRPLDFRLRLAVINGIAFFGYNAEITSRFGFMLRQLIPCDNKALIATSFGHEGCVTDTTNDSYDGKMKQHSFVRSAQEGEAAFIDGLKELVGQYKTKKGVKYLWQKRISHLRSAPEFRRRSGSGSRCL